MKAKITNVVFSKESEGKFGKQYNFLVEYDGKKAYYTSKSQEQTNFVIGSECEFTEEEHASAKTGGKYWVVRPVRANTFQSNYGKALQREQSKYAGFAVSYVKDLIIADKVPLDEWKILAGEMAEFMLALDKRISQ